MIERGKNSVQNIYIVSSLVYMFGVETLEEAINIEIWFEKLSIFLTHLMSISFW